jgi:hypothetical protein
VGVFIGAMFCFYAKNRTKIFLPTPCSKIEEEADVSEKNNELW